MDSALLASEFSAVAGYASLAMAGIVVSVVTLFKMVF